MTSPKRPAADRVNALGDRLSELRDAIQEISDEPGARVTPPPASAAPVHRPAQAGEAPSAPESDEDTRDRVRRMAKLIFASLRGDGRLVRLLVHELAHLEAEHAKRDDGGRG